MNPVLQPVSDLIESQAGQIQTLTDANATLTGQNTDLSGQLATATSDLATADTTNALLSTELSDAQKQVEELNTDIAFYQAGLENAKQAAAKYTLDVCAGRVAPTVFSDIEKYALFLADKKIPFQWIQPGNTGNTGGGSSLTHGSCTWTPGPNGTVISVTPAHIAPKTDNFFFYLVLPYPTVTPKTFTLKMDNYQAASPADWANSQAGECQNEFVGGGYRYTMGLTAIPGRNAVARYRMVQHDWATIPGIPMPDLGSPCSWFAEFSIDTDAKTVTHEALTLNGVRYVIGLTQPAVPSANPNQKEFSTSVQLDGKVTAAPYSALLRGMEVRYL